MISNEYYVTRSSSKKVNGYLESDPKIIYKYLCDAENYLNILSTDPDPALLEIKNNIFIMKNKVEDLQKEIKTLSQPENSLFTW